MGSERGWGGGGAGLRYCSRCGQRAVRFPLGPPPGSAHCLRRLPVVRSWATSLLETQMRETMSSAITVSHQYRAFVGSPLQRGHTVVRVFSAKH